MNMLISELFIVLLLINLYLVIFYSCGIINNNTQNLTETTNLTNNTQNLTETINLTNNTGFNNLSESEFPEVYYLVLNE